MISIIVVTYHIKKELIACISSIYKSSPKTAFEIIVIDNDEEKTIHRILLKKFPDVIYIPNDNKGYGQAMNFGAMHAKGEYLFILNSDTKLFKNSIDALVHYLQKHTSVGIVAPVLYHANKTPFDLQGLGDLNPISAVFSLSFIHKLFPNNPIAQKYWNYNWDKEITREVASVPGTAFVIRKKLFEQIGGFDEKIFIYFEEMDICKRVMERGLKIVMLPQAKIFHAWGSGTKTRKKFFEMKFLESRFYYFKKHYGLITAIFTEAVLRTSKITFSLGLILLLGLFLRTFELTKTMTFIGDQGWYYLSARDMLLTGQIPLVGIPSSHPWLHQGALWTYMLSIPLWIFHYDPLGGGYFAIFIDLLTIFFLYKLGTRFFSRTAGLVAALLYTVSPFIIFHARMPYHTTPIPLVTTLFIFSIFLWLQGRKYYFPISIFFLGILYNLELATAAFWIFFLLILMYGVWKKKSWVLNILERKVLLLSFLGFFLSMWPMLLYDYSHGFVQTLRFCMWIGYKILLAFGYPPLHPVASEAFSTTAQFLISRLSLFIFPSSTLLSTGLFFMMISYSAFWNRTGRNKHYKSIILGLSMFVIVGIFVSKTSSDAYLPMLFPSLVLLLAVSIADSMKYRIGTVVVLFSLFLLTVGNSMYVLSHFTKDVSQGGSFAERKRQAKYIVKEANGREYNLKRSGIGSEHESLSMNYEYLTWWYGKGPSKEQQKLQFIIEQHDKGTRVIKVENNK